MEDKIIELINEGKNYSEIGKILNCHRTTVSKICKKIGIKPFILKHKTCVVCNKDLGENLSNHTKCKTCVTRLRRLRLKIKCVDYLGGECQKCGYNNHLAALQFHHLDPNEKEFTISSSKHSYSWELIQKELDKCILLCSNCHSIEHSKYDDENLVKFL